MGAVAMKRLLLFAFVFFAATDAQAGQTLPSGAPEMTAAIDGGSVADRSLLERLEPVPAPLIPEAPIKSNPLWSIPLSALSETRDRPLFNPSRRPPPEILSVAPSNTDTPLETEGPPFALIGTILGSKARVAVLLDQTNSRVTQLQQGKAESGWTALSVGARSIVLRNGDSLKTLSLPAPTGPQGAAILSGSGR
jgi:hypothetical protein